MNTMSKNNFNFFQKPIAFSENCDIIIDKKSENKQKQNGNGENEK